MSFQDPPRRQRTSRYPAPAQHEDSSSSYQDTQAGYSSGNGYQDGYRGFAGLAGAPRQQAPWDDPSEQSAWDTGAQRSLRTSGAQRSLRTSGAQGFSRTSGAQASLRTSGAQRSMRDSGAQQAAWDAPPWADPPQQTEWDLPRRPSGAFRAVGGDSYRGPQDDGYDRPQGAGGGEQRRGRGLLAGGVAGFLAAAVALGVANLVAAFVRPQASPIIAVGEAFIDRTPPALKNFAVQKFGENDKNMLLLGMYVTIALIAITIGMLAWRRMSIGVAGIGLFGLFGAFVAFTRPESHVTDVIPSVIGGIAGIAVIVWLVRMGMPTSRHRAGWAGGNS